MLTSSNGVPGVNCSLGKISSLFSRSDGVPALPITCHNAAVNAIPAKKAATISHWLGWRTLLLKTLRGVFTPINIFIYNFTRQTLPLLEINNIIYSGGEGSFKNQSGADGRFNFQLEFGIGPRFLHSGTVGADAGKINGD